MTMTVYPASGYNSFVSLSDANAYFTDRLNADAWDGTTGKEAALITAFRSLSELDIVIDLSDAVQLQAIKDAQCEQALHELINISSLDGSKINELSLGGLLKVSIPDEKAGAPRFSSRALNILRPYLRGRSIARTR